MVIASVLGLLALFAIISIVMSGEDSVRPSDHLDNPLLWATLGRR